MINWKNKNIIDIRDFNKTDILYILKKAGELQRKPDAKLLTGTIMASCFFEPSTRTRLSFETAMLRLGGQVIGFADKNTTSATKKETLADTIKIVGQYADAIVIRHPEAGAAAIAAKSTDKPVINAGDGNNQHPTQTLVDLFTIRQCQGKLGRLKIALAGDLKYGRTVHSLAQALKWFKPRLYFVSPPLLKMPNDICHELKQAGIKFSEHDRLDPVIDQADIIYMTRIQTERFTNDKEKKNNAKPEFILAAKLLKRAKPNLKILHPLPRVTEIDPDVDSSKHAYYFEQAANGVYIRQALLGLILGEL